MENIILNSNKVLNRDYGKYCSDLTFVTAKELNSIEDIWQDNIDIQKIINVRFNGMVKVCIGNFRINQKGTKIFDLSQKPTHYLIRVNWGAPLKGDCFPDIENICDFYNRKASNGGGTGYTYYILGIDYHATPDENLI